MSPINPQKKMKNKANGWFSQPVWDLCFGRRVISVSLICFQLSARLCWIKHMFICTSCDGGGHGQEQVRMRSRWSLCTGIAESFLSSLASIIIIIIMVSTVVIIINLAITDIVTVTVMDMTACICPWLSSRPRPVGECFPGALHHSPGSNLGDSPGMSWGDFYPYGRSVTLLLLRATELQFYQNPLQFVYGVRR